MVIPLSVPAFSLTAPALVDSGATDSFVDTAFAKKSGLPATRLKIPRSLRLFDGGLAHSGPITHFVVLDIRPPGGIFEKTYLSSYHLRPFCFLRPRYQLADSPQS